MTFSFLTWEGVRRPFCPFCPLSRKRFCLHFLLREKVGLVYLHRLLLAQPSLDTVPSADTVPAEDTSPEARASRAGPAGEEDSASALPCPPLRPRPRAVAPVPPVPAPWLPRRPAISRPRGSGDP